MARAKGHIMLTREEAHTSISRHRDGKFDANDVGKLIHQIYNEFEAQMKAKDEEIVKLKLEVLNSFPKIANSKSRSIVAMLFWEWKRLERFAKESCSNIYYTKAEKAEDLFKQAYKILKDKA